MYDPCGSRKARQVAVFRKNLPESIQASGDCATERCGLVFSRILQFWRMAFTVHEQ